jgi:hypothetical protein
MRGGAEAHRHLLHYTSHEEGEDYEGDEEPDAESGACRGIGEHAGTVIFAEHHENTGANEEPEEAEAGPKSTTGSRGGNLLAVVGAIDIFVGNDNAARRRPSIIRFGIAEGDRSWIVLTSALRRCISLFHSLTQARGSIRSADN